MKTILFFGNLYHSEASLAAEFKHTGEFEFIPVVDKSLLDFDGFYQNKNPFRNLPEMFGAYVVNDFTSEEAMELIHRHKPDYIIVRCWTSYEKLNIPNAIYWKVESRVRKESGDNLDLILPPIDTLPRLRGFLTALESEVEEYKKHLNVPVSCFPRGVSHYWEKPLKKTITVMACGTIGVNNQYKLDSFETLVKPLCEHIPDKTNVYVHWGRERIIQWAFACLKPPYMAEDSPVMMAKSKIFVCPLSSKFDPGFISHKTIQAMACRTLTIMPNYIGAENLFGVDGENLVYANTSEECLDKVNFYLKHAKEREAIARRGYKFIHSEYNNTNLFKKAMKDIGLYD